MFKYLTLIKILTLIKNTDRGFLFLENSSKTSHYGLPKLLFCFNKVLHRLHLFNVIQNSNKDKTTNYRKPSLNET